MKTGLQTLADFHAPRQSSGIINPGNRATASMPDLQSALLQRRADTAHALSSLKPSPRQAALDRAGLLRQRLEMLKAMLRFASPEMAAKLAKELKSIAKELGDLGQSVGGRTGQSTTSMAATDTSTTDKTEVVAATLAIAPDDRVDSSTETGTTDGTTAHHVASSDEQQGHHDDSSNSATDVEDEVLRKVLLDTQKLLRELLERLKAKLREGNDEARRDLEAAEEAMAKLDSALSQDLVAQLYTAQGGGLSGASGSLALTPLLSVGMVDISV